MRGELGISLTDVKVGEYTSWRNVCQDGYSLSKTPVNSFETGEVLAKVNEHHPLTSTGGTFYSEILKTVFNIGLEKADEAPLWIVPNSVRHRKYNPAQKGEQVVVPAMESPECTLHRQFANLIVKDDTAILNFANKYGLLKYHPVHKMVFRKRHAGPQFQLGESLLWWREEIGDLATCLRLWDMVVAPDKKLKNIVLWHKGGITIRLDDAHKQIVGRANMNLLRTWRKGDVRGPVLYYLSLESDERLRNAFTLNAPTLRNYPVWFYPESLLAAIWLMFLLEVNGNTRLLRCASCGDFFDSQDPRARFCSARCRMRNYRGRSKR